MVDRNLLYLSFAIAFLVWCRWLHIPSVLARESREDVRADRREVVVATWMFGVWSLSTLELFYDAETLMAFVIAAAVTAAATRTALYYVQLLRWVDRVCCEGGDMRRSGVAPPLF
jgi:hypothetical protein